MNTALIVVGIVLSTLISVLWWAISYWGGNTAIRIAVILWWAGTVAAFVTHHATLGWIMIPVTGIAYWVWFKLTTRDYYTSC